jgi:hypothetical protein
MGNERFDLGPGAVEIEGGKAHGDDRGVPVPLVGIEPGGRDRIATAIIAGDDRLSLARQVGIIEGGFSAADIG